MQSDLSLPLELEAKYPSGYNSEIHQYIRLTRPLKKHSSWMLSAHLPETLEYHMKNTGNKRTSSSNCQD